MNKLNGVLEFSARILYWDINGEYKETPIEFENCEKKHFPRLSDAQFSDMDNSLCPIELNSTIFGYWSEPKMQYMHLRLGICNKVTNPECKDYEEINNYITTHEMSINLYFQYNTLNLRSYDSPILYFLSNPYKFLDPTKSSLTNILVNANKLITDQGWIFADYKEDPYTEFEVLQTDFEDNPKGASQLTGFYIYANNKAVKVYRSYIKSQDILAGIGGIIKIVTMAFLIVNYFFSKVSLYGNIMNQIFYLPEFKDSILKTRKLSNVNMPSSLRLHTTTVLNEEMNVSSLIANVKKKQNPTNKLNLSFSHSIRLFCCKSKCCNKNRNNTEKFKFYKIATDEVSSFFDYIYKSKSSRKSAY